MRIECHNCKKRLEVPPTIEGIDACMEEGGWTLVKVRGKNRFQCPECSKAKRSNPKEQ